MAETETEALVAYVDGLQKATLEGKIPWAPFNPTTFTWDRLTPPRVRIALQRVEQNVHVIKEVNERKIATTEKRYLHILTVNGVTEASMNVTINGAQDPRINEKLGAIYDSISIGILEKKIDFLKKTLPE
jgi:hypothetical protein